MANLTTDSRLMISYDTYARPYRTNVIRSECMAMVAVEQANDKTHTSRPAVTVREVNRVLEVGRLLLSVLTQEELEELESQLGAVSDECSQPGTVVSNDIGES